MALILNIETATAVCSVALARDGKNLHFMDDAREHIHGAAITTMISTLLADMNYRLDELDAVAVSAGPGSYTGLRIGVSTAKGLCMGAGKPLIAVSTLEAMSMGFIATKLSEFQHTSEFPILLAPMIDARREEVYTALYTHAGTAVSPVQALVLGTGMFENVLDHHRIICFGSGAHKIGRLEESHPRMSESPDFTNSSSHMAGLSELAFSNENFADLAYYEPFYFKAFYSPATKSGS